MRVMVEMRETEVEETTVEIGSREEIVPYPEPIHDKSVIDYPSDSREDGVGEEVLLEEFDQDPEEDFKPVNQYELEPVHEIPSVDELFDAFVFKVVCQAMACIYKYHSDLIKNIVFLKC